MEQIQLNETTQTNEENKLEQPEHVESIEPIKKKETRGRKKKIKPESTEPPKPKGKRGRKKKVKPEPTEPIIKKETRGRKKKYLTDEERVKAYKQQQKNHRLKHKELQKTTTVGQQYIKNQKIKALRELIYKNEFRIKLYTEKLNLLLNS